RRRRNNDGVGHRPSVLEGGEDAGNIGLLLANRYIDAVQRAILFVASGFSRFVETRLADDGIDTDSCFARGTVADDQFALTAANWNHRVNCHDARLYRLIHGTASYDPWSHFLDRICDIAVDRPFAIQGFAQHIHDPA